MIAGAVSWVLAFFVKETYAPALLRKRAEDRRKETNDERWWSRYDDRQKFRELLKVNLSRPFIMTVMEPIW